MPTKHPKEEMRKKKAVVIHSGGMDSSICLALAMQELGKDAVTSLSFYYGQRHASEIIQAEKICKDWNVAHATLNLSCLSQVTANALINPAVAIEKDPPTTPNTLVVGRNGLMARLGAIYADYLGASFIYLGVIGVEGNYSGYRDCSREYFDLKQKILRIDLANPHFKILTPLVSLTKKETLEIAHRLGILEYLLNTTITCYEGISQAGCQQCPACRLRNKGLQEFKEANPGVLLNVEP